MTRVLDIVEKQLDIREIESLRKRNSFMKVELLEATEKCGLLETTLQLKDQEFSQFRENIETEKRKRRRESEQLINECLMLKKDNDFLRTSIRYLKRPGTSSSMLKNDILDDTEMKSNRTIRIDNKIGLEDYAVCVNGKSEDETSSVEKREDTTYKDIYMELDKKYDELDEKCTFLSKVLNTITEQIIDLSTDVDVERLDTVLNRYERTSRKNASKRSTRTQQEVQGNGSMTTCETRSNEKTDEAFEQLHVEYTAVKEKLDHAEHDLRVTRSKLDAQTRTNDETSEKYDELCGKYTYLKDNVAQLIEGFKCMKQKQQDDLLYMIQTVFTRLDDKYDELITRWMCQGKEFEYASERRIDLPTEKHLDTDSNRNEGKTGENASERSIGTRRGVKENKLITKYVQLLNDKINKTFESLNDEYMMVRETLDDAEHNLSVTQSKLDAQTRMNNKTSNECKILNDENTSTKNNLEATVEKLKCTEQELHVVTSSLNEETCRKVEMFETNDRLEDECRCLRRNFRSTLDILHTTEQKLQDTRLELDEVVGMYQQLKEYTIERHSFERDENDQGDTRPIAEVANTQFECGESALSESQRWTDNYGLLKEKSEYVFAR